MSGPRTSLVLILVIAAFACSEEAVDPASVDSSGVTTTVVSTTTAAPTTTIASTTTTAGREGIEGLDFDYLDPVTFPTIELVDPGLDPREVRAWMPEVGMAVAMTTTLTSMSEQSGGGAEPVNADFTATIGATVEIVAETDEGYVARTTFESTTVSASDPLSQQALEQAYAILSGVEVHQLTRSDGAIIAQAGVDALGQGDVLGNGLGGIAVPLPTEPIGVGAVWTADQVIGVEGIQILQRVTTRIIDIQGDLLTIEIEATSAFDPDSDIERLGPFTLQGSSTGTAVWDLSIGMPVSAFSESVQDVESTDPVAPFAVRTITTIEITSEIVR
ncbi:MAG: hypothetical protein OEQ47_19215 [Acidimicrobiia bacterium]|nr:hypothetical protein [Acidimicrobiia bacterium]